MGPESAHMLIRRQPHPLNLRLFGAGDARLVVVEMGTLVITLVPSANPNAGLAALPRRAIQLVRAQSGYRIGMFSSRPPQADRSAAGRGRRAARASAPACGQSAAETALVPGLAVTDAAVRLAYFDRSTFFAFQGTTHGLRPPRERAVSLEELDPRACTAPLQRRQRVRKASLS